MARYIDADALIAHLKDEIKGCEIPFGSRANGKGIAYGTALGLKSAISFAETLSTADVVPKSELPDDHHKQVACYTLGCREGDKIKREVAREIFEEIESISSDFPIYGNINTVILSERDLAFIKKKYTEGET
jgi:hypothetical protein